MWINKNYSNICLEALRYSCSNNFSIILLYKLSVFSVSEDSYYRITETRREHSMWYQSLYYMLYNLYTNTNKQTNKQTNETHYGLTCLYQSVFLKHYWNLVYSCNKTRSGSHKTFEYEFCTRTSKSSNQRVLSNKYSILIGQYWT